MSRIPGLRRVLRLATGRAPVADDVDAELAFHFAMAERELVARGLTPEAARAEARRRFGDVDARRAELRRVGRRRDRARRAWEWLQGIAHDLRVAARALRHAPGLPAVVVATLALGIGASAMMFGVVDPLLLRPPAHLRDAERAGRVHFTRTVDGGEATHDIASYPLLGDVRDGTAGLLVAAAGAASGLAIAPTGGGASRGCGSASPHDPATLAAVAVVLVVAAVAASVVPGRRAAWPFGVAPGSRHPAARRPAAPRGDGRSRGGDESRGSASPTPSEACSLVRVAASPHQCPATRCQRSRAQRVSPQSPCRCVPPRRSPHSPSAPRAPTPIVPCARSR